MNHPPIGRTLNRIIEFKGEKIIIDYNYQKAYNAEGTKLIGYELLIETIDYADSFTARFDENQLQDIANLIHELDFDLLAEKETI